MTTACMIHTQPSSVLAPSASVEHPAYRHIRDRELSVSKRHHEHCAYEVIDMTHLDIDEVLEEICLAKKIGITLDCVGYLVNSQHHNTGA